MSCGGCGKRKAVREQSKKRYSVMGNYAELPDRQIKARLEVYKKKYCKSCEKRYKCDFVMYSNCNKNNSSN